MGWGWGGGLLEHKLKIPPTSHSYIWLPANIILGFAMEPAVVPLRSAHNPRICYGASICISKYMP